MENNINVSLDKTTEIKCNECDNNTFIDGVMLRKVSKFLVGSPQDALIPIQIMVCIKCHTPLEETLPIQLKQLQN
jgi:hypothetical protein